MPHRPTPHLFSPPDTRERSPAPRWQGLPDEALLTLTGLMVPTILEHAAGAEAPRNDGHRKGAEHET